MAWVTPVTNRTDASKGYFGVAEWNRIEGNHAYLATALGVTITTKTNWAITDIPTLTDIDRIRANTNTLLGVADIRLALMRNYTDYVEINAVEQDLQAVKTMIDNAQHLSDLAVGTIVRDVNTKYGGTAVDWVVGHQASGRTKLLMKKLITSMAFDAKEPSNPTVGRANNGNNRYIYANIRQWLNADTAVWYQAQHTYDQKPITPYVDYSYDTASGFLTFFSANLKGAILSTNVTVAKSSFDGGGVETITNKIYLLSNTEIGVANENGQVEGTKWDLFTNNASRIGYLGDSASYWYLRTPVYDSGSGVRFVYSDGTVLGNSAWSSVLIRPAFELPNTMIVTPHPSEPNTYLL